jgi:hypothetical protein
VIHIRNLRPELVNYLGISEALLVEKENQIAPLLSVGA